MLGPVSEVVLVQGLAGSPLLVGFRPFVNFSVGYLQMTLRTSEVMLTRAVCKLNSTVERQGKYFVAGARDRFQHEPHHETDLKVWDSASTPHPLPTYSPFFLLALPTMNTHFHAPVLNYSTPHYPCCLLDLVFFSASSLFLLVLS